MSRGNRRVFSGPRSYNPALAQQTATSLSREQQLLRELGVEPDDDDHSLGSGSDTDGYSVDHAEADRLTQEVQELKAQLEKVQAEADASAAKSSAELKAMQWRVRSATLATKKQLQSKSNLVSQMIDTIYDLENKLKDAGVELEKSWSDHYDLLNEGAGASSGSPSTSGSSNGAVSAAPMPGGDPVAMVALQKQVKSLKAELAAAKEAKAKAVEAAVAQAGANVVQPPPLPAAAGGASSEEVDRLTARLEAELANSQELKAQLKAAKKAAAAAASSAPASDDGAAQELAELREASAALEEELTTLRKQAAAASSGASDAATAAQSRVTALEGQVKSLKQQLADSSAALAAEAGDKEAKLLKKAEKLSKELEKQRALTAEATAAHDQVVQDANSAMAQWKEKYTAEKKERRQFKKAQAEAERKAAGLQEQLTAKEAELKALQGKVDGLEARLKDSSAASEQMTQLQSALDTAMNKAQATQAELKTARAELEKEKASGNDTKEIVAKLEHKTEKLQKQLEAAAVTQQKAQQQQAEEAEQIITAMRAKFSKRMDRYKGKARMAKALAMTTATHCGQMREAVGVLRADVQQQFTDIGALLARRMRKLARAAESNTATLATVTEKYKKESRARKKLFNQIQELKGNIRVFARVRPVVPREQREGATAAVSFPADGAVTMFNNKNQKKTWEFEHVFTPKHSNADVFDECKDLLTSVVDGYNVCIFAYGQTGAGKTHTMEGEPDNPGLNLRTLQLLFQLREERAQEWDFEIKMSLLEIYNETIADLLASAPLESKLVVRRGEHGNHIPGLTELEVTSSEQVMELMRSGYSTRTTFATDSNEHSSRSHCMLSIHVVGTNKFTGLTVRGKLHLVDLAGSERVNKSGAKGARLKEAQAINKSLSALGDVIAARAAKQRHVPFRNSVLTYVLEDSLSNQSKTLMFVNLSPVLSNSEESFCSLNFASRVRTVELGKASRNVGAGKK